MFQLGVVLVLCLIGRSLAGLVSGGGVLVAGMLLVGRSSVFGWGRGFCLGAFLGLNRCLRSGFLLGGGRATGCAA